MFLYKRSLFLSRKPEMEPEQTSSQCKVVWMCCVTTSDIVVSFTHDAVGDLPGIMQEAEISPLQSLARHFVGQFVSAVREVEGDRGVKSERPNPPSLSAQCRLSGSTASMLMNRD